MAAKVPSTDQLALPFGLPAGTWRGRRVRRRVRMLPPPPTGFVLIFSSRGGGGGSRECGDLISPTQDLGSAAPQWEETRRLWPKKLPQNNPFLMKHSLLPVLKFTSPFAFIFWSRCFQKPPQKVREASDVWKDKKEYKVLELSHESKSNRKHPNSLNSSLGQIKKLNITFVRIHRTHSVFSVLATQSDHFYIQFVYYYQNKSGQLDSIKLKKKKMVSRIIWYLK